LTGLIKFVVADGNMHVSLNIYCHCQHLPDYKKGENGATQWRCAGVFFPRAFVCGFSVGAEIMLPLLMCVKFGCRYFETALLPNVAR